MGHTRLGNLPKSRRWRQVVDLIENNQANLAQIASVTIDAAEGGLQRAAKDQGLIQTFWLLTQITLASRKQDFIESLRRAGLKVSDQPTIFDLLAAFADRVDSQTRHWGGRSDFSEIASLSAQETLSQLLATHSRSLFGTPTDELREALKSYSSPNQFGSLAHSFFSSFLCRYLKLFLSRELSNHVGPGRRFNNLAAHSEFNAALELHCRQISSIVQSFSGSWYSKTEFETGITPEKARDFVHVALKKLRSELQLELGNREA
jgi:hypothetical protein